MATYMRASAVGSAAGGLLWTLHALLINRRPEGCIGDTCGFGVMPRPTEDLAWVFLVAVVLIALGTTTLSRHGGRGERSLAVAGGAALAIAGAVALAAGLVVNAVITGDSPLWWLHDSDSLGRVLPVAGSGLVGIGLLRSRLLAP